MGLERWKEEEKPCMKQSKKDKDVAAVVATQCGKGISVNSKLR